MKSQQNMETIQKVDSGDIQEDQERGESAVQSEVNEATEVEGKDEQIENVQPIISLNESSGANAPREHQQQQFIVKRGLRKRKRTATAHSKGKQMKDYNEIYNNNYLKDLHNSMQPRDLIAEVATKQPKVAVIPGSRRSLQVATARH